ncbi:DUF6483 family protein [Paenibacillus sp. sgz500958]|uniref:DUF6483 family protein n=1 Tax=Paenibacillus sp. sgz500958 TaxID=3242475 RepID=UPI0036D35DAC
MFRRDYIVRMIEDMTQMVAKVLNLKQERKTTEALWEIDELLNRHFRLNSRLLNSLSVEDIIEMFRMGGMMEVDKLQGVARMLQEEAGVYKEKNEQYEAVTRLMKALHLYLYSDLHGADRKLLQLTDLIDEVLSEVSIYQLPVKTERLLLPYLESIGRYGKAEDCLYRLIDQGEDVAVLGEELYRRLLLKDPEELALGNLPLLEVKEGQAEWFQVAARAAQWRA